MKELHREQWSYIFFQDEEEYYLSVICGTVGLFERNIHLNREEVDNYKHSGTDFIAELAEQIRNSPSEFQDRHIELPVE